MQADEEELLATRDLHGARSSVVAVVVLALGVGLAVLVGTRSGIGVTPDSVSYFSVAEAFLRDGHTYQTWSQSLSPQHFPPGWPILIGLVSGTTDLSLESAARVVNSTASAGGVFLVYLAVRRSRARSSELAAVGTAVLLGTNYSYYDVGSKALTESAFIVAVLTALLCAERIERNPAVWTLFAAIASGAAISIRYVGIACVAAVVPLVWRAGPTTQRRIVGVSGVVGLAVTPIVLWYALAPDGARSGTSSHLSAGARAGWDELLFSLRELASLVVGESRSSGPDYWRLISIALGTTMLVTPIVSVVLVHRRAAAGGLQASWSRSARDSGLEPWLWFLAVYLTIVALQRWSINREIIGRYWLPYVVVSMVVAGRGLAVTIEQWSPRRLGHRVAPSGLLLLTAISLLHLSQVAADVRHSELAAAGLNASAYRDSELIARLQTVSARVVITNNVYLVGFYAPDHLELGLDCPIRSQEAVTRHLRDNDSAMVAMFDSCPDDSISAIAQLQGGTITINEPEVGVLIEFGVPANEP